MTSIHRRGRLLPRLLALLAVFALVAASCGDDDDNSSPAPDAEVAEEAPAAGEADAEVAEEASAVDEADEPVATDPPLACSPDAILTWGYGDQIRDWDPHNSPAGQDQWYLMAVYDRLFHQDPDGTTTPGLAESWEYSDDGLTLTMNLRDGVLFHDGTALDADIVVQNLERSRGSTDFSSSFGADLSAIDSVTAVDGTTVVIATSRVDASLPAVLSDRPGMMLHPSTFDGDADASPIGTGPFVLDSWTAGDGGQADLSKFADYWDADTIRIGGLVIKDIRDASARFNALQSGEIDGARIDPVDFDAASSDDSITVLTGDTVEVFWLLLDREITPELGNTAVLQAMSLALDRQALVDGLAFGLGTPSLTHMPPFYYAASPNIEVTAQDLDGARALLADAGVGDFSFPILAGSATGLGSDVTQAVAAMLGEIGITIEIEVAGADLASRLFFDRDGGGVVGPWSGRADPAQTIANVYGPGFVNLAKISVPEIDQLLIDANAALDSGVRQSILQELDEIAAVSHVSGIALFAPKIVFASNNNVSGLDIYVQGKHEFRNVCVAPAAGEADAEVAEEASAVDEADEPVATDPPLACSPDAILTWGYGDQIRDWDPHNSPAGQDQWYLMAVYDRLFHQDPDGTTTPGLAESWEYSDDGLTLTMNLRDGVLFHDGTALDADIVVQNLERSRGSTDFSSSFGADLSAIDSVTAVDGTTVVIATSRVDASLPAVLSDRPGMMLHPSTFDGDADASPIGTGPFVLDSWTAGDGGQADLSKFADYWDADTIRIGGLVIKDIRDASARFNALQSGEIDGARIDPVDFDAASSDDSITVLTGDTVEVFWLLLDREITPELGNTAVLQAMSLALDRQALVDGLAFGLGTPSLTHMPPFYYAASPNIEVTAQDLDGARALLADAGVGDFSFPILAGSATGLGSDVTQAVAAMLGEIGITIEIEVAGADLASRLFFDRDGGGVVGPWSGRADPAQTIANVYGPGFVNLAKISVPEIDQLLIDANAALDSGVRQSILQELDEIAAVSHVSGIALFAPKIVFASNNNVSGLDIYVQGKHEFRNVCVAPA